MKVCFVGTGSIGRRHIKNLISVSKIRGIDCEIHVLRSTNLKLEDEIANLIYREVISITELDDWYDAVFITNPTYKHYETLVKLYDKSRYFFVEKPVFEKTDYELSSLTAGCKVFYVACPLRYTQVLRSAKQILETENVISARAISSSYLPEWRKEIDYRQTYSASKKQGGGVRIDLIHEWDYLVSLFGYPEKVKCMYGTFSNLQIDSEDLAVYMAQYKDKIVEVHLDYFGRKTKRSFEVYTNEHHYLFDLVSNQVEKDDYIVRTFSESPNQKYLREMAYFLDVIYENKPNVNDLEKALNILRLAKDM